MKMEVIASPIESKLSGSRLGDRHKELNQLVKEATPHELSPETLRDLSNKKQVDLVYIARLANYTKNASVICELLKSEDSMVISVALQAKWFFAATSHKHMANVQYFEKEIFPYASYHAVCRIVSTFGACLQDATIAEGFYNYVYEWYGKDLAWKLLPKCGVIFIGSQIKSSLTDVPCAQMFYIYKKDPTLAVEYLTKYLKKENADKKPVNYSLKTNYNKIWKMLAEDNPKVFFDLLKDHSDIMKTELGHRVIREVLKVGKEDIIVNPNKFSDTFRKNYVVKTLKGDDLERFLLNCMPAKEHELSYYWNDFGELKPAFRLKMLRKLNPIKYKGADFLDRDDFLDWNLCEHLSKEERIAWAKKKYQNLKPDSGMREHYLRYMDGGEAIPQLKKMCGTTTEWSKRSTYLEYSVECCSINKDYEELLSLMKYVSKRHRNDHASLRHSFLVNINTHFTLHELSSEYWDIIHEMLDFLVAEKELQKNYWYTSYHSIMQEYVHYCLLNGLDIDPSIEKLATHGRNCINITWDMKNAEYEQKVFAMLAEKLKKQLINPELKLEKQEKYNMLYTFVSAFEEKKQKYFLADYPWLLDYIKENHEHFETYQSLQIFSMLKKHPIARDTLLNEIFANAHDRNTMSYFVMFNPDLVVANMERFIKETVKFESKHNKYNKLYEKIHTYLMHPLGEKIVRALEEHMEKVNIKQSEQLAVDVMFLSYLLSPAQRKVLLQEHVPSELKVDLMNNQREYVNGQVLGKFMKTLNPPVQFDTLQPFIGGDYLKFSLRSLLSLAYRKSKTDAQTFVEGLLNNPVSVKKHSIRLKHFLFPRKDLLSFYKSLWEKEKNPSIRDVVFSFTFKLLVTEENMEQYKEIWTTLKEFMSSLNANDTNIFVHLSNPQVINPLFINDYCKTCWKILKDLSARKIDVSKHISAFTKNLRSCIGLLSEEFCETIIAEYLYSVNDKDSDASKELLMFLVESLVKAKNADIQNKHAASTCKVFTDYIRTNWDKKMDGEFKYRQTITDFVTSCCSESLNLKLDVNPVKLLRNISEMLSSTLSLPSFLNLHLTINATISYIELLVEERFREYSADNSTVTPMEQEIFLILGQKMFDHFKVFISQFGFGAAEVFVNSINNFMSSLYGCNRSTLELCFISGLISSDDISQDGYLLSIYFIPSETPTDEGDTKHYDELVDKITTKGNVTVKIMLNDKVTLAGDSFKG